MGSRRETGSFSSLDFADKLVYDLAPHLCVSYLLLNLLSTLTDYICYTNKMTRPRDSSKSVASDLARIGARRHGANDNDLRPWATETYSARAYDHGIFYRYLSPTFHRSIRTTASLPARILSVVITNW